MRTLKNIIKCTSDYGYPEAYNLSDEECKKLELPTSGTGWNGTYSGEYVRKILQDAARKWYNTISNRDFDDDEEDWSEEPIEVWIKYFFNLEDE